VKILFVAHNFPRHSGDVAGHFLLSLAHGLLQRNHQVLAVVPHDAGLTSRDDIDGVQVRRFRYANDDAETLAYRGTMADQVLRSVGAKVSLLRFMRAARREARRACLEWKPDVANIHWWFPSGLAVGRLRAASGRVPLVLTSHGTDLFLLDKLAAALPLARRVFRRADRVTVISQPLVGRVTALGVPRDSVSVIPMPVDRALLEEPGRANGGEHGDSVRLLFVGRLVERKGAEFAIRALKLLVSRGINASLRILGDGPLRVDLDNLCDELELGTRVHFSGVVPPADVRAEMRAADVFLMPAVTDWKGEQEGFGMVIVEAMLSGVPVVATDSGGITDIIENGANGMLVAERDAEAIAAAVARIARNGELAGRLREAGRQTALQRFHPDSIAERFEEVYLTATQNAR
jgi:glycosyltransferase involved in cell wall biosynthesis